MLYVRRTREGDIIDVISAGFVARWINGAWRDDVPIPATEGSIEDWPFVSVDDEKEAERILAEARAALQNISGLDTGNSTEVVKRNDEG